MNTADQTKTEASTDNAPSEEALWAEAEAADEKALSTTDGDNQANGTDGGDTTSTATADEGKDKGTPAETPAAVDIWANASPEHKAAYEALLEDKRRIEEENRSHRGRQSALMRSHPELFKKSGTGAQPNAGAKSVLETDEFKAAEAEFPEVIKPMKQAMKVLTDQVNAATERFNRMDAVEQQAALDTNEAALAEKHSDWETVAGTEDFLQWVEKQPKHRKAIIKANADNIVDPDAAVEVFDWYKADKAKAQATNEPTPGADKNGKPSGSSPNTPSPSTAKRDLQRAGASAPVTTGPRSVAVQAQDSDDPEVLWRQMDAEERARATA